MSTQTPNPEHQPLPERPTGNRGRNVALLVGVGIVVIGLIAILTQVLGRGTTSATPSASAPASAAARTHVKIGTTEVSASYWTPLKELAAKEGIDIEIVNFSDYTQPNPALSQGQTDLNLFQHLLYLANYNAEAKDDLTPISPTIVVPLSLYSKKHTALDQIPAGGQIAIPNDPTNQARALLVLQQAGLVSLKGGGTVLSTPADIVASKSKVQVTPVDAAQTVASLASVDGAIINNGFALDGNIDPKSALYSDDPGKPAAEPYINAWVARAEDKDNPTYRRITELYHEAAVISEVLADSKDTAVVVKGKSADDLAAILDGLEKTVGDAE